MGGLSSAVALHMHARSTSPAVMKVKVYFGEDDQAPLDLKPQPMNRRNSALLVDALLDEGRHLMRCVEAFD